MAAITAAGSGDWNSTTPNAPWPSGIVPTNADDVTIDAAHAVTVTGAAATAKTLAVNSTAGTKGLDVQESGILTLGNPAVYGVCLTNGSTSSATPSISIGGQLVLKGGVVQGDCPIELYGNGDILVDRTAAHGGTYSWQIGTAHVQPNAYLMTRASGTGQVTKTSRVTVRSSATGSCAPLRFVNGGFVANQMCNMLGVDFTLIGDAATPMFGFLPNESSVPFQLHEFRCVQCGALWPVAVISTAAAQISVTNGTATQSVGSTPWIDFRPEGAMTGTRNFTGLRLDRGMQFGGPNITLSNVVIDLPVTNTLVPVNQLSGATFDVWEDVVWRDRSATSSAMDWPIPSSPAAALRFQRVYGMATSSIDNARWFGMGGNHSAIATPTSFLANRVHAQVIDAADEAGDQFCFAGSNPTAVLSYALTKCMMLPNALDKTKQSAKIISPLGNIANTRWSVEHCMWFTDGMGETGVQCGESQTVNIGQIFTSIRSNIAYTPVGAAPGAVIVRTNAGGARQADLMAAATTDYNGKFGCGTGTDGVGYDAQGAPPNLVSTGTLGVHDVVGNPQFADQRMRDCALWASDMFGDQGSVNANLDNAFAQLFKANDPTGFDARAVISGAPTALIDWVEAGYAPTNPAFHNAAHDGTDIGAVPFAAPASSRHRRLGFAHALGL